MARSRIKNSAHDGGGMEKRKERKGKRKGKKRKEERKGKRKEKKEKEGKKKERERKRKPKKSHLRTGEMAQWLRSLTALPEVLSSNPSNHMVAHNHL